MASSKEQLLALYNAANPNLPHPATLDDIEIYDNPMMGSPDPNKWNTMSYLTAKEESLYFAGSMTIYYNRVPSGITDDAWNSSNPERWDDDAYVLDQMNARLQQTWPDDAFTAQELTIGRSETEDGRLVVMVSIANSIKFLPPDNGHLGFTYTITPKVRDLGRLDGELDGFN
ncbi:hypothetical protein MLDJOKPK_00281 [Salmonella phage SPAsTU]|nr:hypothetical protein MLDJOKPK_00281 [Salmonella phage SPAsTU]